MHFYVYEMYTDYSQKCLIEYIDYSQKCLIESQEGFIFIFLLFGKVCLFPQKNLCNFSWNTKKGRSMKSLPNVGLFFRSFPRFRDYVNKSYMALRWGNMHLFLIQITRSHLLLMNSTVLTTKIFHLNQLWRLKKSLSLSMALVCNLSVTLTATFPCRNSCFH